MTGSPKSRACSKARRTVREPFPVVGNGDGPRDPHLTELGQLRAGLPPRHGPDRVQARTGNAARLRHEVLRDGAVVVDRLGVGHRAHGGEPSGRRGLEARRDSLGLFAPGLAQVRVQVDEPRKDEKSGRVENLRAAGGEIRPYAGDDTLPEEEVERSVAAAGRIHEPPAPDEQRAAHGASPSQA
jgi:hypothetical protein